MGVGCGLCGAVLPREVEVGICGSLGAIFHDGVFCSPPPPLPLTDADRTLRWDPLADCAGLALLA